MKFFSSRISYSTTTTTTIKAYTEYDNSWWVAVVTSIEPLLKELHVKFLHPYRSRISFKFPQILNRLNLELSTFIGLLLQTPMLDSPYDRFPAKGKH
jgi:hypothetical protein